MAYEQQEWKPGKAGGTPFTADRMNHMEQGIFDAAATPGPRGEKGEKGDTGAAGPTQFTPEEVTALKALIADQGGE